MQLEILHSTLNFDLKNAHYSPLVGQKFSINCSLCLFASYLWRKDGNLNQFTITLAIPIIFRICKIMTDSPDGNDGVTILLDLNFLGTQLQ